jgi:DNA repair protein RadC
MKAIQPQEFRIVSLRECPIPTDLALCDQPERAAAYWRTHIRNNPYMDSDKECMVVLLLNTRHRIMGHHLVSIGTLDTTIAHPREIFRSAIIANSSAILLMHNHPSGDPTPSESDIRVTREIIRAGKVIKIEVLDHVIVGLRTTDDPKDFVSLKELGYFYT